MRYAIKLFYFIMISLFLYSNAFCQDLTLVERVSKESAKQIFTVFHRASKYQACDFSVKSINQGLRVELSIDYKGWMKNHNMTVAIYFDKNGPTKLTLLTDSNINKMQQEKKENKSIQIVKQNWKDFSN